MRRTRLAALATLLLVAVAAPAMALQVCGVVPPPSMDEVLPGVVLTWDSAFLCADAPAADAYQFTVNVSNDASSAEAVAIQDLRLVNTTPRPRGQRPAGTITSTTGLPVTLAPGESASFTVEGTYTLVQTDEGAKANLHFQADGMGVTTAALFSLGINAHFRAPGVAAE